MWRWCSVDFKLFNYSLVSFCWVLIFAVDYSLWLWCPILSSSTNHDSLTGISIVLYVLQVCQTRRQGVRGGCPSLVMGWNMEEGERRRWWPSLTYQPSLCIPRWMIWIWYGGVGKKKYGLEDRIECVYGLCNAGNNTEHTRQSMGSKEYVVNINPPVPEFFVQSSPVLSFNLP